MTINCSNKDGSSYLGMEWPTLCLPFLLQLVISNGDEEVAHINFNREKAGTKTGSKFRYDVLYPPLTKEVCTKVKLTIVVQKV